MAFPRPRNARAVADAAVSRSGGAVREAAALARESATAVADTDTTDEILHAAIDHAKAAGYCASGECVVALHRIGNASVIKIVNIP